MKTLSLFSGAGGMDLGAINANAEIIFANDNDPDAAETHRQYFPKTEFYLGDISQIDTFPSAELLIGGYPCQSFSRGGNRCPDKDKRTYLYLEYARALQQVQPLFFVAENVEGLKALQNGHFLDAQIQAFQSAGRYGYNVHWKMLDAKDYGVSQSRRRVFIVGVRKDLGYCYVFPEPTHGNPKKIKGNQKPYSSHGDRIKDLPLWPIGEFYERPHDPEGHWSWYYMSRNRKANWDDPSYTIVANWRHIPVHPASPKMTLTWSNLKDGWKQRWDFSNEYEHLQNDPSRPILTEPRRLSWRECALIQSFPAAFEPFGKVESKFRQIGNAVPPKLAGAVIDHLISKRGLISIEKAQQK